MYGNTSLLSSIFIPDHFETRLLSTESNTLIHDIDFTFEYDTNGTLSIIKLKKIPYIDLTKYDHQRRTWYYVDQYGNLWRKYHEGEFIIETQQRCIRYDNTGYPRIIDPTGYKYISLYGIGNIDGIWDEDVSSSDFEFSQYTPISISLNGLSLNDVTNYSSGESVIPKLDFINTEKNKEFYFNKSNTIYTNQDLNEYEIQNISISYYSNIDKIRLKCRMNTNMTGLSPYTPIVDYYIIKLTGQNL